MIESNLRKDLERKIDLYVNGQLSHEEIDELWAELIQDEYYLDYAKSVASLKAVIENERRETPQIKKLNFRRYASYAAAAAVVLFVGLFGISNFTDSPSTSPTIEAISEVPLGIYRNEGGVLDNSDEDERIKEAIALASNGDDEGALKILNEELEKAETPQRIAKVSLSIGSVEYNFRNYQGSIISFERVVDQAPNVEDRILENGYWFLGNAYFLVDRVDDAKRALIKAYEMDGDYSRSAKNVIDAISQAE